MSPKSRGFVYNSFLKGLEPYEFFFGAITGRDSLMDTALRTPKSGYLYRRLANALQDIRVEYDSTVRDGSGNIMQFKYGEDGKDVSGLHKNKDISSGEAIGIVTAQSFGEPSTQMALNVFHFAGVSEMQSWMRGYINYFSDFLLNPEIAEYIMDTVVEMKMRYWERMLAEVGDLADVVVEADDLAGISHDACGDQRKETGRRRPFGSSDNDDARDEGHD